MKKNILTLSFLSLSLAILTQVPGCSSSSNSQTFIAGQETTTMGTGSSDKRIASSKNEKTVRIGSIDWYVDYDDALAAAKESNRPVWLHFGENPG